MYIVSKQWDVGDAEREGERGDWWCVVTRGHWSAARLRNRQDNTAQTGTGPAGRVSARVNLSSGDPESGHQSGVSG